MSEVPNSCYNEIIEEESSHSTVPSFLTSVPTIEPEFPTLLGDIRETNVVICVEATAKSMDLLGEMKRHVIQALYQLANKSVPRHFNVIVFNSQITQWSNQLVLCRPETVTVCSDWLTDQTPGSTAGTLSALLAALADPQVEAVYLLAVSQPDANTEDILDALAYAVEGRPVHCRFVIGGGQKRDPGDTQTATDASIEESKAEAHAATLSCLEAIAQETEATFAIVEPTTAPAETNTRSHSGGDPGVQRTMNGSVYRRNMSNAAVTATLKNDPLFDYRDVADYLAGTEVVDLERSGNPDFPCYHPYTRWPTVPYPPYTTWSRYTMSDEYRNGQRQKNEHNAAEAKKLMAASPAATALLLGRKILARKVSNGLYYTGRVKSQQGEDIFMISFEPHDQEQYDTTDYQPTRLLELVDYEDASRHAILPGDRILAPDPAQAKQGKPECFVPGTVLEGSEGRDGIGLASNTLLEASATLTVCLTAPSNRTITLPAGRAVWIPDPLYRRLCLEGAMPSGARRRLARVEDYPERSMPGYPTSGAEKKPEVYQLVRPDVIKGRELQVDHLLPPFCLPVYPVVEQLSKDSQYLDQWTSNWYRHGIHCGSKTEEEIDREMAAVIPGTNKTVRNLHKEVRPNS